MSNVCLVELGERYRYALGQEGGKRGEGKRKEDRRRRPSPPPALGDGRNEIAHLLESATQEGGRYYTNLTYQLEQEPQRCESCLLPAGWAR